MTKLIKKTFAIILASGSGTRFESENTPKHLVNLKKVPIIVWTLNTILKSKLFEKIVIVTKDTYSQITVKTISDYFDLKKSKILFAVGAQDRMQSFLNGVSKITSNYNLRNKDLIALFDANRPFCSIEQMLKLNRLANDNGSSCLARPVVNGVAKKKSSKIIEVPKKENFVEFVTPEFVRFEIIEKNRNKKLQSLVEYSLNEALNPVYTDSSDLNSKLTYPEDLEYLEGLINKYNIIKPLKI